jgi:hypothetical protein
MLLTRVRDLIRIFMCMFMVATPFVIMTVSYLSGTSCTEDCPAGYATGIDSEYGNNHSPNATMAQAARVRCGCGLILEGAGVATAIILLLLLRLQEEQGNRISIMIKEKESQLLDEEAQLMEG